MNEMVRLPKVQRTDYAPATGLVHHLLPCVLVTEECSAEVDTEDTIEVLCCS